jgi:hypothetical protein
VVTVLSRDPGQDPLDRAERQAESLVAHLSSAFDKAFSCSD